jgi:hypothetical protein
MKIIHRQKQENIQNKNTMETLKLLKGLPKEKKKMIVDEFDSAEKLYQKIFDLHEEDYKLYKAKSFGYLSRLEEIRNKLYEIEDRLNEMGIDGFSIVTNISKDQEESMTSKKVLELSDEETFKSKSPSKKMALLKKNLEHAF